MKLVAGSRIKHGSDPLRSFFGDVVFDDGATVEKKDRHLAALLDNRHRQRFAFYWNGLPATKALGVFTTGRHVTEKTFGGERLRHLSLLCQLLLSRRALGKKISKLRLFCIAKSKGILKDFVYIWAYHFISREVSVKILALPQAQKKPGAFST